MKEKSSMASMPIYHVSFELVVTDDMIKSQAVEPRFTRLGKQKPYGCDGLAIYREWNFCMMLDKDRINHNLIAHEVFHVTHRMLDYCGVKFRVNNHEAFAYVNGFLSDYVYKQLLAWKIKIK
jgi:hypothetical protein